jgi:predicted SprT family Zn-dependent metalloprotease
MSLKLTPDVLRAAYEYLRATPPFRRWGLPPGEEVHFYVNNLAKSRGEHWSLGDRHHIGISKKCIGSTEALMPVMAHEMCHARQVLIGDRSEHGKPFQKMADQVCRHHEFDRRLF